MYTHTHVHTNIEKINNFPVFACSLVDPLYLHLHSIPVLYKRAACQINIMMRYEYTSYVCLVQEVSPLHALYSERIVYFQRRIYSFTLCTSAIPIICETSLYALHNTHTQRWPEINVHSLHDSQTPVGSYTLISIPTTITGTYFESFL